MTKNERTDLVLAVAKAMRNETAKAATTAIHAVAFHSTDDYTEFDRVRQLGYEAFKEE